MEARLLVGMTECSLIGKRDHVGTANTHAHMHAEVCIPHVALMTSLFKKNWIWMNLSV